MMEQIKNYHARPFGDGSGPPPFSAPMVSPCARTSALMNRPSPPALGLARPGPASPGAPQGALPAVASGLSSY